MTVNPHPVAFGGGALPSSSLARVELGVEDYAKYPFLKEAGEHVKALSLGIEELAQPGFEGVLNRAKQRIMEAVKKGRVSEEVAEPDIEILSFPLALMLVKAAGLPHLTSRLAHAEAIRAERLLGVEKEPVIEHIFRAATGVEVDRSYVELGGRRYEFKLPIAEYLKRAPKFSSEKWKLVNQVVDRGFVLLSRYELVRLFREEISRLIYERVSAAPLPRLPDQLLEIVKGIVEATPAPGRPEYEAGKRPEDYPPCVAHILEMQGKGENIPHFGRFLMATYLLTVGKSVDEIVEMHRTVPDFDERIARYQVEHLAGLRGGRKRYKVPNCRTVISHGMCFKHPILCAGIKNPLQYPAKPLAPKRKAKRDEPAGPKEAL